MSEIKDLLKRIRELELKTKGLVDGMMAGSYKSKIRGRGIEFSEVREYVLGDDVRHIDWNVTARTNKLHVKEFVEERDLRVYVIFDYSASNEFGFQKSKKSIGHEIAASIIFSAMKNNDSIGLGIFTDSLEQFIPARKGRKHSLTLLRTLLSHKTKSKQTDIETSLLQLHHILGQHSIIFIISDYISPNFLRPLKFLKNRHDVILINLSDIRESQLPDIGYTMLEDMESGEQLLVNTSDVTFRESFTKNSLENSEKIKNDITKLKVEMVDVSEQIPFDMALRQFFNQRMRR
ncbi:MAG: DUF58 domain-containing protein [Candidatus Nitrosopelagicus sp.]|nr:DUF58 domain-containing protein [Candidatus Nitrosopelagicus sp.]MDC4231922.1 DUF58 domain-containing protein [Nitrosopumilus sp.]